MFFSNSLDALEACFNYMKIQNLSCGRTRREEAKKMFGFEGILKKVGDGKVQEFHSAEMKAKACNRKGFFKFNT